MKKIRLCLVLAVCFLLGGCVLGDDKEKTESTEYVQYYLNTEETRLETESFATDKTQAADLISAMKETLSSQVSDKHKVPLLPEGVKIQEINLENEQLQLDLSEEYLNLEKTTEILVRAGLVKSFVQFENVDTVCLTVNKNPLQDSSGYPIEAMGLKDFVDTEGREIDAYQYGTFLLYFADSQGNGLIQEERHVYYGTSIPVEREIVDLLSQGPSSGELKATLPSGLGILGVTVSDGIVYVNLDETFINNAQPLEPELIIYSLVNSLVEGSEADKVQISVNGETNLTFKDSVDLNQFFEAREDLVKGAE